MPNTHVTTFENFEDADERIRRLWGRNLTAQIATSGLTPKQVVIEMAHLGLDISAQSISGWCKGDNAPAPSKMIGLGIVLGASPRLLFPLDVEMAAPKAAAA